MHFFVRGVAFSTGVRQLLGQKKQRNTIPPPKNHPPSRSTVPKGHRKNDSHITIPTQQTRQCRPRGTVGG